jgi:hypothetical protein
VNIRSDDSAVGTQHLAIDPSRIGSSKKGDNIRDVTRLAETLERRHLRHAIHDLLRFTFEEEVGGGGAWSDSIYRDVAAAQFLGEHTSTKGDPPALPGRQ